MLDSVTILFGFAVLIDLSLLVLASRLVVTPIFKPKGYWLLVYVLTALNSDYATAILKFDRTLGYRLKLFETLILPPNINHVIDLLGRVSLLIAIWLFIVHFLRTRREGRVAYTAR